MSKSYTNIEGAQIKFPVYILAFHEDFQFPLDSALRLPIYHTFNKHYGAPEFKISSLSDLIEFGKYIIGATRPDEDPLGTAENLMLEASDVPHHDAAFGDLLILEGDLVSEAMAELRKIS